MDRHEMLSRIRMSDEKSEQMLFYLVVLLCLGVVGKTAQALIQKHSIGRSVAESMAFLQVQNEKANEYLEAYCIETEKLKEAGIFCPEKKEPSPPQVTGILGNSVLMNNKWCNVGDEYAGAKVLKIESTEITILWKEKEMKLAPLLASHSDDSVESQKKTAAKKEKPRVTTDIHQAQTETAVAPKSEDDPLAWLGMDISTALRNFLVQLFETMPDEQVEAAKQEWANLSQDEKQQRLDEAQAMVDSGQADMMLEQMKANQG